MAVCGASDWVWRSLVACLNGVQEAGGSNPLTQTTASEQSPLCSDVFFASGRCICRKKAAVAPLPCSSFSAKGPARLACSLASALTTARCRYQPFAAAAPRGAGDGPGRARRTEKTRRRSRQYGVRPSEKPPRRCKVRFAPTSFLLLADASAAKKPPSPRSLAPPFPQKAPLGSPVRLQARSQRLAVATNLLRLPRLAGVIAGRFGGSGPVGRSGPAGAETNRPNTSRRFTHTGRAGGRTGRNGSFFLPTTARCATMLTAGAHTPRRFPAAGIRFGAHIPFRRNDGTGRRDGLKIRW